MRNHTQASDQGLTTKASAVRHQFARPRPRLAIDIDHVLHRLEVALLDGSQSPLHDLGDRHEADAAVEERLDGDLVGGVNYLRQALAMPELQEIQRIRFEARIDFIREFMTELRTAGAEPPARPAS